MKKLFCFSILIAAYSHGNRDGSASSRRSISVPVSETSVEIRRKIKPGDRVEIVFGPSGDASKMQTCLKNIEVLSISDPKTTVLANGENSRHATVELKVTPHEAQSIVQLIQDDRMLSLNRAN